ncbi:MAG: cysteine synthase family protein [Bacteroidales bacterium]|nr:cysteine synthase family protein [Bacteroidales bacterium]MDD2425835.1 cysteine synthase family protein [Bacteroidales bacterium]MDD3990121.1 cysteine synthase family protein [Bacteroidales bacterium]
MENKYEDKKRIAYLKGLIGKTPLIEIRYSYKGVERTIYAKAEYLNFTGSIKDRMAYYIMWDAVLSGKLKPGMMVAEATSGNTGISIVAISRFLGHEVTIFMPDWMSSERISLIKSFGANIRLVSKEEGGFLGSIAMANKLKEENPDKVFLPLQFDNEMNSSAHYFSTGPEIYNQLNSQGIIPDAFVAGVGTGGTVMGAGRFLKEAYPNIKVHPLEPANSPTLSVGHRIGKHRIQGISDEFIPSIVKLDQLDEIVDVEDGDAIIMAQNLAKRFGLALGISSGANFLGAVKLQNRHNDIVNLQNKQGYDMNLQNTQGDAMSLQNKQVYDMNLQNTQGYAGIPGNTNSPGRDYQDYSVVTVFPDDNKKYLSTDYNKEEPVKSGYLSPDIKLLDMRAIPYY